MPLYRVDVEITSEAFVYASSDSEAKKFAREIVDDDHEKYMYVTARKANASMTMRHEDELLYHNGPEDMTVLQALQADPEPELDLTLPLPGMEHLFEDGAEEDGAEEEESQ